MRLPFFRQNDGAASMLSKRVGAAAIGEVGGGGGPESGGEAGGADVAGGGDGPAQAATTATSVSARP